MIGRTEARRIDSNEKEINIYIHKTRILTCLKIKINKILSETKSSGGLRIRMKKANFVVVVLDASSKKKNKTKRIKLHNKNNNHHLVS